MDFRQVTGSVSRQQRPEDPIVLSAGAVGVAGAAVVGSATPTSDLAWCNELPAQSRAAFASIMSTAIFMSKA